MNRITIARKRGNQKTGSPEGRFDRSVDRVSRSLAYDLHLLGQFRAASPSVSILRLLSRYQDLKVRHLVQAIPLCLFRTKPSYSDPGKHGCPTALRRLRLVAFLGAVYVSIDVRV